MGWSLVQLVTRWGSASPGLAILLAVNCAFTLSYGACSATCGTGTQSVTPVITTQPANGGAACPVATTQSCTVAACPGAPASWAHCRATCAL